MRGFKDNIPPVSYGIEHVRKAFEKYSQLYGCDMIDMPIVEEASFYFRTSGDASDICNKELFEVRRYKSEFEDWVLRPEGTAGCMRTIKENALMQHSKQLRLAYFAPMFRYNRPQKGRYRQFLQAGWEFVGIDGPYMDCELIIGAVQFLKEFNINFTLEINSIGNADDRKKYRENLRRKLNLPPETDPLKILDKAEDTNAFPTMQLNNTDATNFGKLQELLNKNEIPYVVNPYLVRGLDYYNSTVFEAKIEGQTILAGGRYDGLMEQIGGKPTPAVGFGAGVDRIVDHLNYQHQNKNIAIIPVDAEEYAYQVAKNMRDDNLNCVIFWGLDLKKALAEADKQNYKFALICGSAEKNTQQVQLKNLQTGEKHTCALEQALTLISF